MTGTKQTQRKERKEKKITPEPSSDEYMEDSSGDEVRSKVGENEDRGKENVPRKGVMMRVSTATTMKWRLKRLLQQIPRVATSRT